MYIHDRIFCRVSKCALFEGYFRRGKNRLEIGRKYHFGLSLRLAAQNAVWRDFFGWWTSQVPREVEKKLELLRVALAWPLMQWYEFSETKKTGTKNTKKNRYQFHSLFLLALGNMLWCLTALLLIGSYFMWLLVGLEGGGLLTSRSLSDIDTKYKTSRKTRHILLDLRTAPVDK